MTKRLVALAAVLLALNPPAASAQAVPATECDRLAAPPGVVEGVAGIAAARIEVAPARAACAQTRTTYPNEPRFAALLGRVEYVANRHADAARLFREAAQRGNAVGQTNLGVMYERGQGGVPKDAAEAVRLYRLGAAQGFVVAQYNRIAADAGAIGGQTGLAYMYESGLGGLRRSRSEAIRLYRLAAAQGSEQARAELQRLTATPERARGR